MDQTMIIFEPSADLLVAARGNAAAGRIGAMMVKRVS